MSTKSHKTGSFGFLVLAAIALFLSVLMPEAQAQWSLTLQHKYDLGSNRSSEGLDFYNGYLWHTTGDSLYKLDPETAIDTDGDGDYDLSAERTWILTHNNYSESSVWFNDELYNFTYWDTLNNLSDDIFKLDLNDDETYQWQIAGVGQSATNWGSCRDKRTPGESIIYTGHYANLLMWFDPYSGNTTQTLEITGLDDIEDLGMDLYETVWASSHDSNLYPGLHRIDPGTGNILATFDGPDGLGIIDGIAIRSFVDHDVMYVTGKNTRFIWEYRISESTAVGFSGRLVSETLELHPNYPNPFNPVTRISYYVPEHSQVRLNIYDVTGKLVANLVDGVVGAGLHTVTWEAGGAAGNIYFYRLQADETSVTRKMLLLK
ncbi:MAG: T9SS type A sorting domain-containing protein [Candidatus Latescibacterota bacterium]